MKKSILMVIVLIGFITAGGAALAQGGPPGKGRGMMPPMPPAPPGPPCMGEDCPGPGPGMWFGPEMKKKFEELRLKILKDDVGLSEEKIKKVVEIMDKFHEQDRKIFKKIRSVNLKLEALVLDGDANQQKYKDLVNEARKVRNERHDLKNQEFDALQKMLTPMEQAKCMLALEDVRKRFHQKMKWRHGMMGGEGPEEDEGPPPPAKP